MWAEVPLCDEQVKHRSGLVVLWVREGAGQRGQRRMEKAMGFQSSSVWMYDETTGPRNWPWVRPWRQALARQRVREI